MISDQPSTAMGHVLLASQIALAVVLLLAGGLAALHFARRGRDAGSRSLLLGASCLVLIAVILALAVAILTHGPLVGIDAAFSRALFAHRTAGMDQAMMLISALGDGRGRTVGTIVLAAYLLWRRKPRWALALGAVMIASAVLAPALKSAFRFARPSLLYSGADAFSFPSGHATSAAALYIMLAWIAARPLSGRLKAVPWTLAAVMVGLTGLSRVYVGAHWLSDVLAGFALGGALGVAGVWLASGSPPKVPAQRRDGLAILALLVVVGAVLGPAAFRKAQRLYAPYLARPMERVVDPGHLGDPDRTPTVSPPGG